MFVSKSVFFTINLPFVSNKDEEGRSGPFVDRIREQEKLEKAMYVKEIENALTGNR